MRGHLTAARGRRARPPRRGAAAGADPLLRRDGPRVGAAEAADSYGGPVELAQEEPVYTV